MARPLFPAPALLALALSACGPASAPPLPTPAPPVRPTAPAIGLDRVLGHDAAALVALFGRPALDLTEGPSRKLQFRSAACVLDAYLYPPNGGGAPVATWIDARTPAGADFDRASCIAALARAEPPHVAAPARGRSRR